MQQIVRFPSLTLRWSKVACYHRLLLAIVIATMIASDTRLSENPGLGVPEEINKLNKLINNDNNNDNDSNNSNNNNNNNNNNNLLIENKLKKSQNPVQRKFPLKIPNEPT